MNGALISVTNMFVSAACTALLCISNFAWHVVIATAIVAVAAVLLSVEVSI